MKQKVKKYSQKNAEPVESPKTTGITVGTYKKKTARQMIDEHDEKLKKILNI
jgi:hypothetical protein